MALSVYSEHRSMKMEVCPDGSEWSQFGSLVGQDGFLSAPDVHEDACTQTEGYSICKAIPVVEGPDMEVPFQSQGSLQGEISANSNSSLVSPPLLHGRKGIFYMREKTPNILKSMKEKHRENERLRHHSLNQHLRDICKSVPGSAEDGKETKVVMMQRIISYMSYLENTIKSLCHQLNVNPHERWTILTSSLKDIERAGTWTKEFAATHSDDSEDCITYPSSSLHLKLSSPTIDSTTDPCIAQPVAAACSPHGLDPDCEEATVPSTPSLLSEEPELATQEMQWVPSSENAAIHEAEAFDALLGGNGFHESFFEFPSTATESKLMESPCEVKWLGSPEKSPISLQERASVFGIQCDPHAPEDQVCDLPQTLAVVSPDKIIPTQLVRGSVEKDCALQSQPSLPSGETVKSTSTAHTVQLCSSGPVWGQILPGSDSFGTSLDADDTQMVPIRPSKRKQSSPRRTALFNITNYITPETSFKFDGSMRVDSAWMNRESPTPKRHCQGIDFHGVLKEELEESDVNEDIADSALEEECAKVLREASVAVQSKLDLRKSSWMNGFMMYSRIHRKKFIKRNPGFHTAIISKLMGHAWRSMSSEEQQPYTEKAKACARELQRMLDANYHLVNDS